MKFSLFFLPCYRESFSASQSAFLEEIIDAAVVADRLGWDKLWCSEHHFHYYGGAVPNPAMLLLACARATQHIRLGPAISLLPLNNPLRVAEDYLMLDQLSRGRLEMGLGRGFLQHEFRPFGVTDETNRSKFNEAAEILRLAFRGEPFSFKGEHNNFDKLQVLPGPYQSKIPMWVAGSRSRETFEWAGANGHGLMMNRYPLSDEAMSAQFRIYADSYATAGHDPAKRPTMISLMAHIAPTEKEAMEIGKPALQEHMTMVRRLRENNLWYTDYLGDESVFGTGSDASVKDYIANRTLIGTVDQVCKRLERYRKMGFDEASFIVRFGAISAAQSLRTIEILERQVRPHFDRQLKAA